MCPSFVEAALEGFGETLLQSVNERLATLDPFFSVDHDDKAHAILSSSQLLVLDEQGRVRLPDALIAHAGLKDRVTFVGMGQKFQIWEPETFAPVQAERLERARAVRAAAIRGPANG
jgi:MraZ protein